MEIEAFLADSVAAAEGKLYVQGGGWNVINTQRVPTRHPRVGIGVLVRVPYTATNQKHELSISLEDEDGNEISIGDAPVGVETEDGKVRRIEADFNVGRPPTITPGDEQVVPLAVNLDGVEFKDAKGYRVVIRIDGEELKRLPFRVIALQHMRMAG